MICEQLGENGLCIPLNAFNKGTTRNTVGCQSVGCEDTCPVRLLMIEHTQSLKHLREAHHDPMTLLEEHTAEVFRTGHALQELPSLEGIRALGARFA